MMMKAPSAAIFCRNICARRFARLADGAWFRFRPGRISSRRSGCWTSPRNMISSKASSAGWNWFLPRVMNGIAASPKLKSVRHVVQGRTGRQSFILRPDFQSRHSRAEKFSLVYDILILERHLPPTIRQGVAHPDQVFNLDHRKPSRDGLLSRGIKIRELRKSNVYEVSGMVTGRIFRRGRKRNRDPILRRGAGAFGRAD